MASSGSPARVGDVFTRVVNAVLLLIVGIVLGGVGTVAHQITLDWGVALPVGLVGSLLAFAALLTGLRLLASNRVPALLVALGTIATILLFSQQSAGGSVLIPNTLAGQIWLVGPIVIAAVVLAWPDLKRA